MTTEEQRQENGERAADAPFGQGWLESFAGTFMGVLFAPQSTFKALSEKQRSDLSGIGGAVAVVLLASCLNGLPADGAQSGAWLALKLFFGLGLGVFGWLLLASVFILVSLAFGQPQSRSRACLVNTGWAFLPWLFMAPISLYRDALGPGSALLFFLPMIWVVCLQWFAVREALALKDWQALCLLGLLPQLFLFAYLFWACRILSTVIAALAAWGA